ncbi:uncharacterized protein LOC118455084 [Neolamprologus brichardi]|uniref:uncharacterized protein LOC118455084 n=1 Tax=Neolamprologus brichardi TaxID=32507 RepID=UPI00164397E0|nr:uncharacterized protein LOC118455084 [Neolamprologus brichardi]
MIPNAVFLTLSVCLGLFCPTASSHGRSAKKAGCFRVNSCKCIMENGSGVINLKAMEDADGFLGRLKPVAAGGVDAEVLLSFSPCQHFSLPDDFTGSDCTGVAACLIVRLGHISQYINYGNHEGNEFYYNDTLKLLSVSYFAVLLLLTGSCALRPFRSSSGAQISPEHSVWCIICYLFADRRPAGRHDTDATDCTQDDGHCSSPQPGSFLQCA